ncbi:MotA/TolQ/ExbB proton channel family protein [Pseudaeromonas sp. ZJS20]|uniref:MotA/TolQ/ExbB proton channel family protein n=1 Tax=Pseudaeromonas aegiceratis TaxID=3153928 RepID=UPI00390C8647
MSRLLLCLLLLSGLLSAKEAPVAPLAARQAELKQLLEQGAQLDSQVSQLELKLQGQRRQLTAQGADLQALQGQVRRSAEALVSRWTDSVLALTQSTQLAELKQLLQGDERQLPRLLTAVSQGWLMLWQQGGQRQRVNLIRPDVQGRTQSGTLVALGRWALFDANGFYSLSEGALRPPAWQPDRQTQAALIQYLSASPQQWQLVPLDLQQGKTLQRLATRPDLGGRLTQAGPIGLLLLLLALLGGGTVLWRSWVLWRESRLMRQQVDLAESQPNNALGRLRQRAAQWQALERDTLELQLDDCLLQEQARLERGLAWLKLLIPVAPMLGLLGTVTGMIATFQGLSDSAGGEPTLMAGGIATALVTTVLGLVAAMPLLLAHGLLQSRVEQLSLRLEQEALRLLADWTPRHG